MIKHLSQIDFHVVALLLLLIPIAHFLLPLRYGFLALALLPQGFVLTRAGALRTSEHPVATRYLCVNELFLGLVAASYWAYLEGRSLLR
jgi:hypothetical protein